MRRSPVLSILSGWALMMAGDLDGLELRLDDAEAALAAGAHDPELAARVGGHRGPAHGAGDDLGLPRVAGPGARRRRRHRAPRPARARPGRPRGPLRARCRRRLPRPGRLGGRRRPGGAVHLRRGGPQPARRGEPGRRAGQHGGARRPVGRLGPAQPRPPAVRAGACRRPPRAPSRTRGPPPTSTSAWPSSTGSSTTSTSAEAHLETARVLGERASITENRHRWFVAMAQVRAAAGDFGTAARPARPGRGAVPARLLPRRPSPRRDEGPSPDRRGGPVVGGRMGRRPRRHRRRRRGLPARVRAPDPGCGSCWPSTARPARPASRATSRRCALGLLDRLLAAATSAGAGRQRAGDPRAAGPRPRRPRRPTSGPGGTGPGARRGAGAGRLRPAVPGRGRPDADPPARRRRCRA